MSNTTAATQTALIADDRADYEAQVAAAGAGTISTPPTGNAVDLPF